MTRPVTAGAVTIGRASTRHRKAYAHAIGIAIDEGLLTPETRVADLLPSMKFGNGADTVTIRHLLTMSSGIDFAWFAGQPVAVSGPGPGEVASTLIATV